jgi:hypothetical protein
MNKLFGDNYAYNRLQGRNETISLKGWILAVNQSCKDKLELLQATDQLSRNGHIIDDLCDYMTELPDWYKLHINKEDVKEYLCGCGYKHDECIGINELLVEILQGVVDKDGFELKIYLECDRICSRDLDSDDEEEEEDEEQPCYKCSKPLEEVDQVILNSQFMKPYCFECSELVKTDNWLKKELGDKYITMEEAEKQAKKTTPCEKCGKKVRDKEICVKGGKDLCFNCKYGRG